MPLLPVGSSITKLLAASELCLTNGSSHGVSLTSPACLLSHQPAHLLAQEEGKQYKLKIDTRLIEKDLARSLGAKFVDSR